MVWPLSDRESRPIVGAKHKMKLYGRLQVGGVRTDPGGDRLGAFTYNSLADLEANRPASFTRTFGAASARFEATWMNW